MTLILFSDILKFYFVINKDMLNIADIKIKPRQNFKQLI